MRKILMLLLLTSCGPNFRSVQFTNVNCHVSRNEGITTINCPDGSITTIKDGQDGITGSTGNSGTNGHSAAFSQSSVDTSVCTNGGYAISAGVDLNDNHLLELTETTQVAIICNGLNGQNGSNGSTGATGQAGTNGTNGTNGQDAPPTAFTPVGLVDPCGDAPGRYDEVFLKLANGMLLASFSDNANGMNTRFSVLTPGSYGTTDGDNCVFTVNSSGVITYENHHY